MRRTEDLIFGVTGRKLWLRVLSGRPASATAKCYLDTQSEDDDETEEWSVSGVVDTPSTTVDVASGPAQDNPRKLSVASTSSMKVGRKLYVEENGLGNWVDPLEIVTNDYLLLRYPLPRDFTTAATVKSTWISFVVNATWIADEDNLSSLLDPSPDYRLRCEVTNVDGETEVHYIFFDVVRAPFDHSAVMSDLALRWPGLMHQLDADQVTDGGNAVVESAWQSLRADFAAIGINEAAIGDAEGLDEAMLLKLCAILATGGMHPSNFGPEAFYDIAQAQFNDYFDRNYRVVLTRAIRPSTSGAADEEQEAAPFWSK